MGNILDFSLHNPVVLGRKIRDLRQKEGLTLTQAATALEISPITLDGWEQGRKPQILPEDAEAAFKQFKKDTNDCYKAGNNLFFGVFPIRIAKEILGLNSSEMADKCGYSASYWTKMEANARIVPPEKIREIEKWVSEAWEAACSSFEIEK